VFDCCKKIGSNLKSPFDCPKRKSPDALMKIGEIARIQSIVNNALNNANRAGKSIS